MFVVALVEVFVVDVWMLLVVLDTALGSSGAVLLSVLLREAGPVLLDTSLIVMLSSLLGCSS